MRTGVVFSDFNEQEPDAGTAGGYSDEWNGSCVKEEIIIKIFKICDESLICVTYLFMTDKNLMMQRQCSDFRFIK